MATGTSKRKGKGKPGGHLLGRQPRPMSAVAAERAELDRLKLGLVERSTRGSQSAAKLLTMTNDELVEHLVNSAETTRELIELRNRFSRNTDELCAACEAGGLTVRQIADLLDVSTQNVYQRINRWKGRQS